MEIEPIEVDTTSTQAELPAQLALEVSFEINNASNTDFRFDDDSDPNNTSVSFSGPGFCPSASMLDDLLLLLDNDNTATNADAVLVIDFSSQVDGPIFHVDNLDRAAWDFSPTTLDLTLLSGNGEASLINGVLSDSDPSTSGGDLSADASVRVNGAFSSIVVNLREITPGGNDSFGLQISVDQNLFTNVAVPVLGSAGYAVLILLVAVVGCSKLVARKRSSS